MEIRFIKADPTQNMTILVDQPVPRELHSRVAAALMDYNSVYAEQVGFLMEPSLSGASIRLQMMGGEFCGNATMACASYLALSEGQPDASDRIYPIEVSGAPDVLDCRIIRNGNIFRGTVSMPLPEKIVEYRFSNGVSCPVVFFPGIAHMIMLEHLPFDAAEISSYCSELDVEALGIIRCDQTLSYIRPLVYVRSTDTAVYERGCGSGTAAVIAYRAHLKGTDDSGNIVQPGGTIFAECGLVGTKIKAIRITGNVRISAVGTAFVDV